MTPCKKHIALLNISIFFLIFITFGPFILVFAFDIFYELFRHYVLRKKRLSQISPILWFMDFFIIKPSRWLNDFLNGDD